MEQEESDDLSEVADRETEEEQEAGGESPTAAYEYAQRQIKWQQQQEIQEEDAQIQEAVWLDQQT